MTETTATGDLKLDDFRAKLARAKEKKTEKQAVVFHDKIIELEDHIKDLAAKEHSVSMQVKTLKDKLEDHAEVLAETRINKDALIDAGEDWDALIADLQGRIEKIKNDIEKCGSDLKDLTAQKLTANDQINAMRHGLKRMDSTRLQSIDEDNIGNYKPIVEGVKNVALPEDKLRACKDILNLLRPEIKTIFDDAMDLGMKLTAFHGDKHIRTLYTQELVGRVRMFQAEPEFYNLNSAEVDVLSKVFGYARECSKMYVVGFIDALSGRAARRPDNFNSWTEYVKDAKKQLRNYLNPTTEAPLYGVVAAAEPKQEAKIPEVIEYSAEPTDKKEKEKPKSSDEKLFREIVKASGVLSRTTNMRVACIAGEASKNEPLRSFICDTLELRRLTWHDRRVNEDLIQSIKNKGIDLLLAIPHWYKGYRFYADFAEKNGIRVLILTERNKFKICQQIALLYGIKLALPE